MPVGASPAKGSGGAPALNSASAGALDKKSKRTLKTVAKESARNSRNAKQLGSGGDVSGTGQNAEVQSYVVNKIELLKRTQFSMKKVTQLCSFIPDFILMDEINRKIPYQFSLEAVVHMADISGFTALTEAYSLRGKGGTDQLTKTLAGYIGPLAECILQANGDIVKYAGDAFLAYWSTNQEHYAEEYFIYAKSKIQQSS